MAVFNRLDSYKRWKEGVHHCTLDPKGPGVVRIHLIPPRFRLFHNDDAIVILNGYYLLPLGPAWAELLCALMDEINRFDGKPIDDAEREIILANTAKAMAKAYPFVDKQTFREDAYAMMETLLAVAHGEDPQIPLERMSIRSYSRAMSAPHRMDLMISAMTDNQGLWKCNQKCAFCYAAGQKYSSATEMSTEEWKQALDRLRKARVPMVTFTGGEPTLRSDLAELVAYAKWFVTRLNTNGVVLTPELARALYDASLDSVQITFYSHNAEIHNRLVGSEHYADTLNGIRAALDAGLDVSVNTPLCRLNADYGKTLDLLHEMGVRFVTVSGLICTGMAGINHEEFDLSRDELREIIRQAKEKCNAYEMEIDFTSPGLLESDALVTLGMNVPSCGAALSNMAVAPDGTVVPCQSWLCEEGKLGHILTDSFSSIWNHPFCKKLRAMSEEEALQCPFRTKGKEFSKP